MMGSQIYIRGAAPLTRPLAEKYSRGSCAPYTPRSGKNYTRKVYAKIYTLTFDLLTVLFPDRAYVVLGG